MREGWKKVAISDVCIMIKRGQAPSYTESKSVTVLNQKCIRDGRINLEFSRQTDANLKPVNEWAYLNATDTIVNSTGVGTLGRVAFVKNLIEPTTVDSHVTIVRPDNKKVEPSFLGLSLNFREADIEKLAAGSSGQTELSREALGNLVITLPTFPEQKRIVDLISAVDSYIESLQQQLKCAKRSRNAVLHALLTAGGDNWVETTLGEVAHLNPEQARDYDSDRLIKYIDLSTVTFDTGISTEIEKLPFNEAPGRARRIIKEKDVIVSTVRPYLKGFAFVGKEFDGQIASTGFCVIRAKSESILSELIWALVGSDDFVDFLIKRSTGSNYPAVRPNDISDFTFMLPPLHDQETVSKLITTFDDTIRASAVLIDSAQNLRSGLLSDLLSGEHEIPASYDKVIGAA
jgi:restriction endonuclease S subunit